MSVSDRPTAALSLAINNLRPWQETVLGGTRDAIRRAEHSRAYREAPADERASIVRTVVAEELESWANYHFDAEIVAEREPGMSLAMWVASEAGRTSLHVGPLAFVDFRALAAEFIAMVTEDVT